MTLVCMVCQRVTDGPKHNPKIIKWICLKCVRTQEGQHLMDELDAEANKKEGFSIPEK